MHVELDERGRGAQHEPHTGALGCGSGQLRVGDGSGAPGQPLRQQAMRGALEVERAAQEVGGDGDGGDRRHDPILPLDHSAG